MALFTQYQIFTSDLNLLSIFFQMADPGIVKCKLYEMLSKMYSLWLNQITLVTPFKFHFTIYV